MTLNKVSINKLNYLALNRRGTIAFRRVELFYRTLNLLEILLGKVLHPCQETYYGLELFKLSHLYI